MRHMSEYSHCLKISGYSEQERFHAIRGSIMRYEELSKMAREGTIKSVNRTKSEILSKKLEKGGLTASNWFMKDKTKCVMTCQPTPGGLLARKLREALNQDPRKGRILVTEDGGLPVICSQRTDPFRIHECRF